MDQSRTKAKQQPSHCQDDEERSFEFCVHVPHVTMWKFWASYQRSLTPRTAAQPLFDRMARILAQKIKQRTEVGRAAEPGGRGRESWRLWAHVLNLGRHSHTGAGSHKVPSSVTK